MDFHHHLNSLKGLAAMGVVLGRYFGIVHHIDMCGPHHCLGTVDFCWALATGRLQSGHSYLGSRLEDRDLDSATVVPAHNEPVWAPDPVLHRIHCCDSLGFGCTSGSLGCSLEVVAVDLAYTFVRLCDRIDIVVAKAPDLVAIAADIDRST